MPRSRLLDQISRNLQRPFRRTARPIQRLFVERTRQLFAQQRSATGQPWKSLTLEYAERKRGPQILIESGRLFSSLTNPRSGDHIFRQRRDQLFLGTSVPYAGPVEEQRSFLAAFPEAIAQTFLENIVRRR